MNAVARKHGWFANTYEHVLGNEIKSLVQSHHQISF